MMASTTDSSGARTASANKDERIIGSVRAADWLRRWVANGNSVELMPDGRLWVLYAWDSTVGGGWPVRDELEVQLVRDRAVPAIKALMARAGLSRLGELACPA